MRGKKSVYIYVVVSEFENPYFSSLSKRNHDDAHELYISSPHDVQFTLYKPELILRITHFYALMNTITFLLRAKVKPFNSRPRIVATV